MEDLSPWKEKFEECIYAKKLLDKLEYLNTKVINPVDPEEIKNQVILIILIRLKWRLCLQNLQQWKYLSFTLL